MSHQVIVKYEGMTIQIQSQCETAIHSLCKIDKVLDKIRTTATKLETNKVKEFEDYLITSKEIIKKKINDFKKTIDVYRNKVDVASEYEKLKNQLHQQSKELFDVVNDLTGDKIAVIEEMINEGLLNSSQEVSQKLLNKINGVVSISDEVIAKINQIEDVSLRELAYREILKNEQVDFNIALTQAQEEYNKLLSKQTVKVINEYKEELKSQGILTEALNQARTITEANAITNELITDEKIRKETLKVIIKAIKARGFIVDTSKNLKIDKEKNIVKLVAMKASGQMAKFEIQLNGKFMYHFDGYEGLACNKDITPFIEDLKNIYDINILHEDFKWSNPDKIQTKKYQYSDKNKGKN